MTEPFGKDDNQHTGDKSECGPKPGHVLPGGMGGGLIDKKKVIGNQRAQCREAKHDHRFQVVPQKIDPFDYHPVTALTKFMKKPGEMPMTTEMTAAIINGTTMIIGASFTPV